jgi:hypothetical protein
MSHEFTPWANATRDHGPRGAAHHRVRRYARDDTKARRTKRSGALEKWLTVV